MHQPLICMTEGEFIRGDDFVHIPPPMPPWRPQRARLLEDLYACGTAQAILITLDSDGALVEGDEITIYDPLATVDDRVLFEEDADEDGVLRLPAGRCLYIGKLPDALLGYYEPIGFDGRCCLQGSGSGSAEEGSGSIEEGSGSIEEGSGSIEEGSGSIEEGSGSGCITPESLGLPAPPAGGPWDLVVENGCFTYKARCCTDEPCCQTLAIDLTNWGWTADPAHPHKPDYTVIESSGTKPLCSWVLSDSEAPNFSDMKLSVVKDGSNHYILTAEVIKWVVPDDPDNVLNVTHHWTADLGTDPAAADCKTWSSLELECVENSGNYIHITGV
jgi:hypothetical protein